MEPQERRRSRRANGGEALAAETPDMRALAPGPSWPSSSRRRHHLPLMATLLFAQCASSWCSSGGPCTWQWESTQIDPDR